MICVISFFKQWINNWLWDFRQIHISRRFQLTHTHSLTGMHFIYNTDILTVVLTLHIVYWKCSIHPSGEYTYMILYPFRQSNKRGKELVIWSKPLWLKIHSESPFLYHGECLSDEKNHILCPFARQVTVELCMCGGEITSGKYVITGGT